MGGSPEHQLANFKQEGSTRPSFGKFTPHLRVVAETTVAGTKSLKLLEPGMEYKQP